MNFICCTVQVTNCCTISLIIDRCKMKRPSEIIYTCSSPFDSKFLLEPNLDFTCKLPLVDYSFTDDEDNIVDQEVEHSLNTLQSSLAQLGSPMPPMKVRRKMKHNCTQSNFNRDVGTRLSLKLQQEQKAEAFRKRQLISQATGDILSSMHVCEAEAPRKRQRLDFTSFTKRISLRKGHKSKGLGSQSRKWKTTVSDKILGLFQK